MIIQILKTVSAIGLLITCAACSQPVPNNFSPPAKTDWRPTGVPMTVTNNNSVIPDPVAFQTMHGGINNTDHLWIAAAPMFELDWVAEESMYIPEGPTHDRQGNLYFSPLSPKENVSLVSINGSTGERRWTIEGDGYNAGSGAILVLNDPDNPGQDIIYHATYGHAMAITTAGDTLWKTPTGITPTVNGLNDQSKALHSWGMNYHPGTDSVIGVTADGYVFAMDRKTGSSRNALFNLPGKATPPSSERPANWILAIADKETEKVFGTLPDGGGFFTAIVDAIFGGSSKVTNFYGVDPNTSKIFIAATAPDGDDGEVDGISNFGALYLMDLVENNGTFSFNIEKKVSFDGGTGSTPSISPDGSRVLVSDSANNVIAYDPNLNELWRVNVEEQVAASIAISSDNNEIYAITKTNIFKIIDQQTYGEIQWKADLDAWSGFHAEFNALTPTITANGIVVSIGAGYEVTNQGQKQQLMLGVGMGLLDRDTGKLRYFAQGREESIAVSSVGADGAIYTANSPVRRAVGRAIQPNLTAPIIGGISRYKPIRNDLLVRDASCAANHRIQNLLTWMVDHPMVATKDLKQITALTQQASQALSKAADESVLSETAISELRDWIDLALTQLERSEIDAAKQSLSLVCDSFS